MHTNHHDAAGPTGLPRRTILKGGAGAAIAATGLLGRNAFAAPDVKLGWIQPVQ